MHYRHHDIRAALAAAKASGRDTKGMHADDRQTVLTLERWGHLPVNGDEVDERIAAWYIAQGLAVPDITRDHGRGAAAIARQEARRVRALDAGAPAGPTLAVDNAPRLEDLYLGDTPEVARQALEVARTAALGALSAVEVAAAALALVEHSHAAGRAAG